jgi:phosphohistidine phosphatase
MKKLVLIRHAKSDWNNPWLEDHDRPLAERGLKDAPTMAKRLKKRNLNPEIILSSTALRAVETAKITSKELNFPEEEICFEKNLYHASAGTILKYIHHQKDSKNTLLIFGHNPGLNELISFLGGKIENLPTSGQFGFILKSDRWNDLKPENVEVWFEDFPKKKG